ncbi:MAG: helix-turn-helix domain-containing protein [Candidatus Kariarchaeaceae archaeon]|jgi:predicted DNA binding protein
MIQSRLRISSKDYYSCELTKKYRVKVSIFAINGDNGFGILEVDEHPTSEIEKYIDDLRHSPSIKEVFVTHRSENMFWTKVVHNLSTPSIHDTILETGNMTQLPIIIQNGYQYHTIFSPSSNQFRELILNLKKRFSDIEVLRSSSIPYDKPESILTEKQIEAFQLAYSRGYYQIPHRVKLDDIAHEIGIRRVALQERLRRAENRILRIFAQENLGYI